MKPLVNRSTERWRFWSRPALVRWRSRRRVRSSAALPELHAAASSSKVAVHLESLGSLDAIAFDKTGTFTEGEPKVTDVRTARESMKRIAANCHRRRRSQQSSAAKAVVRDGKKRLGEGELRRRHSEATDLQSITGRGIQATVEGDIVHIGKDDLFAEVDGPPLPDSVREIVESLEENGRTTMIVRRGDRYLGVIGLMDTPREASKRTIRDCANSASSG